MSRLLLAVLGLALRPAAPAALAASAPRARPRSVILISLDDLRADRVGARRDGRPLTPSIDRLAAGGAEFENAVAQAPWTLPSMATVFTGLLPDRHGLVNRYAAGPGGQREAARLPDRLRTLAEAFRGAGYETAAFTGGSGLDRAFGFSRGFDVYEDSTPFAGLAATAPRALSWIGGRGERPFFVFLHGYDVHGLHAGSGGGPEELEARRLEEAAVAGQPVSADARQRARLSELYDERVRRADEKLGGFLDALRTIPAASTSSTIIALISDHGEELFEHGGLGHGPTLYDEVLRVLLVLSGPGVPRARVAAQVRLMDVAATLLDLAGVADPRFAAQSQGTDLRPFMEGRPLALDAAAETDFLYRTSKRALRGAGGRKIIVDMDTLARQAYDLSADPGEAHDLDADRPEWEAALERRLEAALRTPR